MKDSYRCLEPEELSATPRLTGKLRVGFISSLSPLEFLRDRWQNLVNYFTHPSELRIWQTRDRFGNPYWQAYDPATGKSISSGSEAEIRAWIEQLYR